MIGEIKMMVYGNNQAEFLMKKAEAFLKIVRKYEDKYPEVYEEVFMGKGTAAIISIDPATGRPEHNVWAVMETMYNDYREHPERKINKKLEEVLNEVLSTEKLKLYMPTAINELMYQLDCEKKGIAPFKVNSIKMLNGLKQNIVENRNKFELGNMMEELEGYNETLKKHFDQSIL